MVKTITTTGRFLLDDVRDEFTCWNCDGIGFFEVSVLDKDSHMLIPDHEEPCEECHGTGLNLQN